MVGRILEINDDIGPIKVYVKYACSESGYSVCVMFKSSFF